MFLRQNFQHFHFGGKRDGSEDTIVSMNAYAAYRDERSLPEPEKYTPEH